MKDLFTQKKKQSNIKPGKIYTSKRQALSQISHYPKSVLIDQYYLSNLPNSKTQQTYSKEKIIKFVGNYDENIKIIIQNLDSLKLCQNKILMNKQKQIIESEVYQILQIFYAKIQKTRNQRNFYKTSLQTLKTQVQANKETQRIELNALKQQNCRLIKQKQVISKQLQNQSKKRQYFQRQYNFIKLKQSNSSSNQLSNMQFIEDFQDNQQEEIENMQQNKRTQNKKASVVDKSFNKKNNKVLTHEKFLNNNNITDLQTKTQISQQKQTYNFYSYLQQKPEQIQKEDEQSQQQQQKTKEDKIEKKKLQQLLKKYNLVPGQLSQIIEEYIRQLKENHQIDFKNEKQKNLYFLAKKMESKIWNNKIKKDIQRLMIQQK